MFKSCSPDESDDEIEFVPRSPDIPPPPTTDDAPAMSSEHSPDDVSESESESESKDDEVAEDQESEAVDPYAQYIVEVGPHYSPRRKCSYPRPFFWKKTGRYYSHDSPLAERFHQRELEIWAKGERADQLHVPPRLFSSLSQNWWTDDCSFSKVLNCSGVPVVLDIGTATSKIGYAGNTSPTAVFPSIVGRTMGPGIMVGMEARDCYVGAEALARRGILKFRFPMEHAHVGNWNDLEKIVHHCFYQNLRITPEEHPVLVTHRYGAPMYNLEKKITIMMETFYLPALHVAMDSRSSLFASGEISGTLVNSGEAETRFMCFQEGDIVGMDEIESLGHHDRHFDWGGASADQLYFLRFGGRDVTTYLAKILGERGFELATRSELEIAKQLKERRGRVSRDFQGDLRGGERGERGIFEYELPDGENLQMGCEAFRAPESLFQPELIGFTFPGLSRLLHAAIGRAEKATARSSDVSLFRKVVLAGGNTLLRGIEERIKLDVPGTTVVAPENRRFSAWIGTSALASLDSFKNEWIVRDEYEEQGAANMIRKCVRKLGWAGVCSGIRQVVLGDDDWGVEDRIRFLIGCAVLHRQGWIGLRVGLKPGVSLTMLRIFNQK